MNFEQAMTVVFLLSAVGLIMGGIMFWLLASEPNS